MVEPLIRNYPGLIFRGIKRIHGGWPTVSIAIKMTAMSEPGSKSIGQKLTQYVGRLTKEYV
jgi:hypothetical protein